MEKNRRKSDSIARTSQWAERIACCRNSGLSVKDWCKQEGLSENAYFYWQRKVRQESRSDETQFVEVTSGRHQKPKVAATIQAKGIHIEIHTGADQETISALLQGIQSC